MSSGESAMGTMELSHVLSWAEVRIEAERGRMEDRQSAENLCSGGERSRQGVSERGPGSESEAGSTVASEAASAVGMQGPCFASSSSAGSDDDSWSLAWIVFARAGEGEEAV